MIDEITITALSGQGSISMKAGDHQGYWLGAVDWGQAQGQHQSYRYLNQVGESIVSTSLMTRPLSISGWVVDAVGDGMRARCDRLNTFFSPAEDYTLTYRDRKITFRPDSSIVYSPDFKANNRLLRQFLIEGTCPYPLFSAQEATLVPFDFSQKRFRFPADLGRQKPVVFATTEKSYSVEAYNIGGFQTGMTAQLRFSGEVRNPRIKNLTTGELIGMSRTFGQGERLTIVTEAGRKGMTLQTADGKKQNLIKYRDYRTSWMQLVPGRNLLALDCDDLEQRDSMTVTVSFTPLYLEVE